MEGSIMGNIIGIGYFLMFQAAGIFIMYRVLHKEKRIHRILLGSVLGSVLLQWLPAITSLIIGKFSKVSHLLAMAVLFFVFAAICLQCRKKGYKKEKNSVSVKENKMLLAVLPAFAIFAYLLCSHAFVMAEDGSMHTGQATFGDMNMHLTFITSIAKQGIFPPEYSMLPGVKLCYPFLCDSISSSIYIWGSSLRLAYVLPALFAGLQLITGVLLLGKEILQSWTKTVLAHIFFFFNGGLGIMYFLKGITKDTSVFTRIFTEFYQTPTNYNEKNIRWSNVIVDMILPQRATLFGWAVLIPAVLLLYKAVKGKKKSYFVMSGIFAASLPMIHTHSFLAMGFICAGWLLYSLMATIRKEFLENKPAFEHTLLFSFAVIMLLLDIIRRNYTLPAYVYLFIGGAGIAFVIILALIFVKRSFSDLEGRKMLLNWGMLLGIVILFAVPQLLFWTFKQSQGEQFLRGHFNWVNETDFYLWFYVKNMGIVLVLGIIGLIFAKRKMWSVFSPAVFIWFVAEMMVFQPNEYDNNKLFYIAYLFLCFVAADFCVELLKKVSIRFLRAACICVVCMISSISAVLTIGREWVSDYELYSKDALAMCKYIEKNTKPTDVILTGTQHNNPVCSLTGRNIVCGSSAYLFYHGLDYRGKEQAVMEMYNSIDNTALLKQNQVKYIYLSDSERMDYVITDEKKWEQWYPLKHKTGNVSLYTVYE